MLAISRLFFFFFFNDTATTEIYTLSLHDALPISFFGAGAGQSNTGGDNNSFFGRSEEHTSELQSLAYLVCRLLLEKKKNSVEGPVSYCYQLTRKWTRPAIGSP